MKTIQYDGNIELGNYYTDMPNNDYHAHNSQSKSGLSVLLEDPLKFFNKVPVVQTRNMQIGSAIHSAILEPHLFESDYVLLTEVQYRTAIEYKQAKKNFGEEFVFVGNEVSNILGMRTALHNHKEAYELLDGCDHFELSGFTQCPETGIHIRHRFDGLNLRDGWAVDLKKTQCALEFEISKTIYNLKYYIQDPFYCDQFKLITGEELKGMKFIFVEEKFPHRVAVVYLDDISREIGRMEYKSALMQLKQYQDHPETQPVNDDASYMVALPEWVLRQYEDSIF